MENKNWGKKYMLVLWSITLVVILCGLAYNLGGFGFHYLSATNVGEYEDFDYSGDEFSSIEVNVDAADLDIRYGDTYMVSTNIPKKYQPVINVKDGKLEIQQKKLNHPINSFKSLKEECSIEITIPTGTKLEDVDIVVDAGDIDIETVKGKSISISADAGDIDLKNVEFESTTVDADAGDIEAKDSKLGKLKIEADLGDIDADKTDFDYGKITADMGDISIDGAFNRLEAECDLGNINITTPNPDYDNMDLDVSLGSITVNGKKW